MLTLEETAVGPPSPATLRSLERHVWGERIQKPLQPIDLLSRRALMAVALDEMNPGHRLARKVLARRYNLNRWERDGKTVIRQIKGDER